jgi:hypothetical protein
MTNTFLSPASVHWRSNASPSTFCCIRSFSLFHTHARVLFTCYRTLQSFLFIIGCVPDRCLRLDYDRNNNCGISIFAHSLKRQQSSNKQRGTKEINKRGSGYRTHVENNDTQTYGKEIKDHRIPVDTCNTHKSIFCSPRNEGRGTVGVSFSRVKKKNNNSDRITIWKYL